MKQLAKTPVIRNMRYLNFFLLLFLSLQCFAQTVDKKTVTATRIDNAPSIDGVLDDAVWQKLPKYGDFNMLQPGTEGEIPEGYETQFQMAYDDRAVYFAVYLNDPDIENTASQFSQRDDLNVQADFISIALNTYNDGINETRFGITSAGTIFDSKVSLNNEDLGYNVVFEARMTKDATGWYAEFKLPYNTLRFPEAEVQDWSINLYRRLININETHSFAPINIEKGRQTQYNALITGVRGIDPPLRLTFFPFAQGVVNSVDGETELNTSAGLDIKYGISDSFTLDATLIPDFGQAGFDNVTLNLGPFEQTFSEQRQFFNEGTELFNTGRIFFSRRVGSAPTGNIEANDTLLIDKFPDRVQLLNAIKVSGRTRSKLGVGIFNAVTENTFVPVRDTVTGIVRDVVVEPLSNYNIVVLDQQFNDNSSVSIINTNVTREGDFRDANVTGLVFDLSDKKNRYNLSGRGIYSNLNVPTGIQSGFLSELDFAKTDGNFRWRVGHDFANKTYNINDFGISFRNNFNSFVAGVSYEIFEPKSIFNKYRFRLTGRHRRLYDPGVMTGNELNLDAFFVLRSRFAFGTNVDYRSDNDDYFEPRIDGKFVTFPASLGLRSFISSDYRKKFALDVSINYREYFEETQDRYSIDFSPRYRFSDKFLLILSADYSQHNNQFGYVNDNGVDVFFGQRDIKSLENSVSASYNFDPYKAIDLRFRNFWTTVDYSDDIFFILNDNGTRDRTMYDISENNPNANFNIWNLDLSFRWRFAPGSEATLLYRNQIFNEDEQATLDYTESLGTLFEQPSQNTLSLRITYFLDYNNIKYLFDKNS